LQAGQLPGQRPGQPGPCAPAQAGSLTLVAGPPDFRSWNLAGAHRPGRRGAWQHCAQGDPPLRPAGPDRSL